MYIYVNPTLQPDNFVGYVALLWRQKPICYQLIIPNSNTERVREDYNYFYDFRRRRWVPDNLHIIMRIMNSLNFPHHRYVCTIGKIRSSIPQRCMNWLNFLLRSHTHALLKTLHYYNIRKDITTNAWLYYFESNLSPSSFLDYSIQIMNFFHLSLHIRAKPIS